MDWGPVFGVGQIPKQEASVRKRVSLLAGLVVVLALLAAQVSVVYAAPLATAAPDGTIVSVTQSTDVNSNTIFVVVVTDSNNVNQTVDMTPAEAEAAGLVTDNGDGTFTINGVAGDQIVNGMLQTQGQGDSNPCDVPDGANPVDSALTGFFCGGGALGGDTIEGLHQDGYGYGLIAQACFMAEALGTSCGDVLDAKSSKDFSGLGLPDGTDVTNWGQLRKFVLGEEVKSLTNLGAIQSGRATPSVGSTPEPTQEPSLISPSAGTNGANGGGHGNGNGNHGDKGKGGGNGHGRP
jgi:hypothetical protein